MSWEEMSVLRKAADPARRIVSRVSGGERWARWFDAPWKRTLLTLAALIALTLVAAHPSMFRAMPATDDGLLHLYRLVGLDHALRHGEIWPRYVPGMAYGYGIPVFNYYAPVSLYPMEVFHLLGVGFLDSFLLGMILYTFLGVVGAYLLGKVWGGPLAGIVASAAFIYAPYTILDWPRRGAIAEYLALVLAVWLLWATYHVAQSGRRRDVIAASILLALTVMAHNISGLWAAGLLIPYSAILWWKAPDPQRAFVRLMLAYLLGIGLSAVYWIPALLEVDAVQIDLAFQNIGEFSFTAHFRTLGQIFGLPVTTDLTQIGTPYPRSVGWPQFALTLVAGGLIAARGRIRKTNSPRADLRHFLILTAVLVPILVFMMTAASSRLWETLPLLPFFQIPWRMLGPISILLAVGAGGGAALVAHRLPGSLWRVLWIGGVLLAIIGYGLPWLYGNYLPEPAARSIVDAQNYERLHNHVGGTSAGEYLPIHVHAWPDPDRLAGLYAQSEVIPRLQPNDAISVEEMVWGVLSADLLLNVRQDTTLTFDWLYWPGFRATLDGVPVPITPSEPNGFLTVDVPAGEHEVSIGFGLTPLRRWATIASLAALVVLIGLLFVRPLWRVPDARQAVSEGPGWPQIAPLLVTATVVGLAAFGLKALLLDNIDSPIKANRFAHGLESGLDYPVQANIGGEAELMGFDLPRATVRSGDTLDFVVYWTPSDDAIPVDLSTTYVLRDADGQIVQQMLNFIPGVTTTTWVPGFYVREVVHLDLPPGTAPGDYTLQAGVYSHEMGRNLDVLNAAGSPTGVLVDLAPIRVVRPRRPATMADLPVPIRPDQRISDQLWLVAASDVPDTASVGQEFGMVWYWRALADMSEGRQARLVWLDEDGEIAGATRSLPLVVGFPTEAWRDRDLWRGVHLLYVPGALEAGKYEVAVQVLDADEPVGAAVPIGAMEVSTPPRTFEPPDDVQIHAGARWSNGITLLGYDLPEMDVANGDGLLVTFYWQASEQLAQSLTVFVHLYTDEGVIVAQRDQIPVGGARPTTGWAPDEVLTDRYQLFIEEDVPPGTYHLRVGWYNALTAERFRLVDGQEFWPLPGEIQVTAP